MSLLRLGRPSPATSRSGGRQARSTGGSQVANVRQLGPCTSQSSLNLFELHGQGIGRVGPSSPRPRTDLFEQVGSRQRCRHNAPPLDLLRQAPPPCRCPRGAVRPLSAALRNGASQSAAAMRARPTRALVLASGQEGHPPRLRHPCSAPRSLGKPTTGPRPMPTRPLPATQALLAAAPAGGYWLQAAGSGTCRETAPESQFGILPLPFPFPSWTTPRFRSASAAAVLDCASSLTLLSAAMAVRRVVDVSPHGLLCSYRCTPIPASFARHIYAYFPSPPPLSGFPHPTSITDLHLPPGRYRLLTPPLLSAEDEHGPLFVLCPPPDRLRPHFAPISVHIFPRLFGPFVGPADLATFPLFPPSSHGPLGCKRMSRIFSLPPLWVLLKR